MPAVKYRFRRKSLILLWSPNDYEQRRTDILAEGVSPLHH